MKNLILAQILLALTLGSALTTAAPVSLAGSAASMERQYRIAHTYGLAFLETSGALNRVSSTNRLERVYPDRYMHLHDVSFPYAKPGTRLFLARLSAQYHNHCGEKLVVTSLLRPRDRQPANSSARSIHPTGMAVDLRIPANARCRNWLENTLLSLERENVLDVTRERFPPHYHVAVFTRAYETRVAALTGGSPSPRTAVAAAPAPNVAPSPGGTYQRYTVRRGDTLSGIAARKGVTVAQLRAVNSLRGSLINVGQNLRIPTDASTSGGNTIMASNEITHRVNRGDTLWRIANQYGTSVQQLRQVNGQKSDVLRVGQVLRISEG